MFEIVVDPDIIVANAVANHGNADKAARSYADTVLSFGLIDTPLTETELHNLTTTIKEKYI